jgi:hypothetical protein
MKKTLLLIASGIAFSVNAQIVHTVLTPDSIVSSNYDLDIDLDNNNVDDYRFHGEVVAGPPSSEFTFIEAGGVGSSNYTLNSSATELSVLNFGDPINSGATIWQQLTSTNAVMTTYVSASPVAGLWPNQTDKFVGVQFLINSNYHYGWIKLSTDATTNQITVKEYAYNTTSGQQILAGQTIATSINELEEKQFKMYPNPAKSYVQINEYGKNLKTIDLYDVTGKKIDVRSNPGLNNSIKLDLMGVKKGLYLVKLTTNDSQILTQRLIVE